MLLQVASFLLTHEIILGIDISEVRHCCVLRQISFFLSIPDFAHHVLRKFWRYSWDNMRLVSAFHCRHRCIEADHLGTTHQTAP